MKSHKNYHNTLKKNISIAIAVVFSTGVYCQTKLSEEQVIKVSNYIFTLEEKDSLVNSALQSINDEEVLAAQTNSDKIKILILKNQKLNTQMKTLMTQNGDLTASLARFGNKPFNNAEESYHEELEVPLNYVAFDLNKAEIHQRDFIALNQTVSFLKNNPEQQIIIEGHCDESGSRSTNLKLSADRALVVKKYFIQQGIKASRIFTLGLGYYKSLFPKTKEESAKNRMCEIKAIK